MYHKRVHAINNVLKARLLLTSPLFSANDCIKLYTFVMRFILRGFGFANWANSLKTSTSSDVNLKETSAVSSDFLLSPSISFEYVLSLSIRAVNSIRKSNWKYKSARADLMDSRALFSAMQTATSQVSDWSDAILKIQGTLHGRKDETSQSPVSRCFYSQILN